VLLYLKVASCRMAGPLSNSRSSGPSLQPPPSHSSSCSATLVLRAFQTSVVLEFTLLLGPAAGNAPRVMGARRLEHVLHVAPYASTEVAGPSTDFALVRPSHSALVSFQSLAYFKGNLLWAVGGTASGSIEVSHSHSHVPVITCNLSHIDIRYTTVGIYDFVRSPSIHLSIYTTD
jgi:hypothetical protein